MAQATKNAYEQFKIIPNKHPNGHFPFADTLQLEKYRRLFALNITEIFHSIPKKIEGSFKFFLLSAVYRSNPVTMKKIEIILEA